MAEVHGRLTGQPGVCLGTLGPGAANLVTGVADADMDRAPLVVITGQADSQRQHKESHQHMDVVAMYEPITKWSHAIINPQSIPEIVRKAFRLAKIEKPGAAHIELAEDIAGMEVPNDLPILNPVRLRRPVPDDKIVDRAFELIKTAKRPIIIAGNGCIRRRASKQLRKFCDATGVGVVSTFMAKGCVDMDAPYCLFTIGLQARDHVFHAVHDADLVITLGYDMVEYPPRLWNPDGSKRIIHVDFLPAEIDSRYQLEVEIVGDLAHTLWMLNERVRASGKLDYDLRSQAQVRAAMLCDFAEHKDDATEGTIRPQKVLWDVRQALGPSDIVLSDVGAHKMWIARYYHCHEPNTCLIPNGFCSMGFALPGAIAAHLVHPERNILAICGDGGFLMNCQEMETARRLNANINVMVWVDGGYGLISWKQDVEHGRHTNLSFGNPDFAKLAEAFGWNSFNVSRSADLAPMLRESLRTPGPNLIALPIDYRENPRLTKRLGEIKCSI
jgi:acetolactate synthase-1/2/3 large subunit